MDARVGSLATILQTPPLFGVPIKNASVTLIPTTGNLLPNCFPTPSHHRQEPFRFNSLPKAKHQVHAADIACWYVERKRSLKHPQGTSFSSAGGYGTRRIR